MMHRCLFLLTFLLFPLLADAHTVTYHSGFLAGFKHPVLGLDHLLAMLSVGILSAQLGGRFIWTVPAAFVVMMLFGSLLGMRDFPLIAVELGIQISVLVLGLAIFIKKKLPLVLIFTFVSFFALFHGYAHGTEIPYLAKPQFYILGFVTGSAVIHLVGAVLGGYLQKSVRAAQLLRYLGLAIACVGLYFIALGIVPHG